MVDIRKPRAGSMAFRPRKRAKKENVEVYWPRVDEQRVLGFAGYKAGMVSVAHIDPFESPTKGQEIVDAATVIEVPPLMVYGVRAYKDGMSVGEFVVDSEEVAQRLNIKHRKDKSVDDVVNGADFLRLLVYTQPFKTSFGKKHVERFELGLGGDVEGQRQLVEQWLGKEMRVGDVFKVGEFVDTIAVTKGKGWQGPVKRFGVSLQRPKATGRRRHVGTLGAWHPNYILYTVPRAGQMGYHKRTELNKWIMKIGNGEEDFKGKDGFPRYGIVRNDYVLLKGSVPGPVKRLVKLRLAVRRFGEVKEPKIMSLIV